MINLDPEKMLLNSIALSELKRQRLRTGLGSALIVRKLPKGVDAPTASMIEGWVNGQRKFAKPAHLELVLTTYAKQPDGNARQASTYVTMTDELRQELRLIHGKSASGYLGHAPGRMTPSKLSHLVNGRTKKISVALLKFFRNDALKIKSPQQLPPYPPDPDLVEVRRIPARPVQKYGRKALPDGTTYIDITDELHTQLHGEIARTQVSPRLLLKSLSDFPQGLNAQMVRNWHSGKIQSAEPHYFEFIINAYCALPTA